MKRVGLSLKCNSGAQSQISKLRLSRGSFSVTRVVKHTLEDFSNILLEINAFSLHPTLFPDKSFTFFSAIQGRALEGLSDLMSVMQADQTTLSQDLLYPART